MATEGDSAMLKAGGAAPREEVHQRLLELLAEQSRRVPLAVGLLLVLVAWMASRVLPPWIPATWLLAALAVLLVRREWLGRLPDQLGVPTARRMRIAIALSFVNGCTHGVSLAAFPFLGESERSFFTLLLLGLSTGAVYGRFRSKNELLREADQTQGFNAQTDTYENLVQAGVIDPTKVVRTALQDAASVAGLLITTEAAVSEVPEDKPAMPMGGGGMGGMGGMDF